MKNALFQVDEALHKKFKMLCAVKGTTMGKKLTEFMEEFIKSDGAMLDNPDMPTSKLPSGEPKIFATPQEWSKYLRHVNDFTLESVDIRLHMLEYLLEFSSYQDSRKDIKLVRKNEKLLTDSSDGDYLRKTSIRSEVNRRRKQEL